MLVLKIYLLGCILAYPIASDFIKWYEKISGEKNLINEFQKRMTEIKYDVNRNYLRNFMLGFITTFSWITFLVWSYFKVKQLYYSIIDYLYRK